MRLRRRRSSRAKPVVLWAVLLFMASQIVVAVVANRKFPEHYDPEYEVRLQTLRARQLATPARPLLFVIGSSRTVMSFRPEILPPLTAANGDAVLPFNFSHRGSGPLVNLIQLQRLIREGQRPQWLILELMPPLLSEHHFQYLVTQNAAVADLPNLSSYVPLWRLLPSYMKSQMTPTYVHRHNLMRSTLPEWDAGDPRQPWQRITLEPLGGAARWCVAQSTSLEESIRLTHFARSLYSDLLSQFHIDPMSDQALRETLELCRRERIEAVLLLSPESSEFRGWYPPHAKKRLMEYCAVLDRDFGVPTVDATEWLADGDFVDGHHVLLSGANAFTERLWREVLAPLTAGFLQHTD